MTARLFDMEDTPEGRYAVICALVVKSLPHKADIADFKKVLAPFVAQQDLRIRLGFVKWLMSSDAAEKGRGLALFGIGQELQAELETINGQCQELLKLLRKV